MLPAENGETILATTQRRALRQRHDGRIRRVDLAAGRRAEHQECELARERRADALHEREKAAQLALRVGSDSRHDASEHRLATFLCHFDKSMKAGDKFQPPVGGARVTALNTARGS